MRNIVVFGGSKGVGREFIKQNIKSKRNKIFLLSRENINIQSSQINFYRTDFLNTKNLVQNLINIAKESYQIDAILFSHRYRPKREKNIREDFIVNVEATCIAIEYLKNFFKPDGLKSMVIIGSVASKFVATEQDIGYHISKSSLEAVTKYFAVKFGKDGIRTNMIMPITTIKDENKKFYEQNPNIVSSYSSINPLKRMLKAEDIVKLISFLFSKKSNFINGEIIRIDGGVSLLAQESLVRMLCGI